VEHPVELDDDRLGDVVAEQLEAMVVEQVIDVAALPGEEVVEAQDLVPHAEQTLAQVRADEASAAGHEDARHRRLS